MKNNSKKHRIFKVGISKKHKGFMLIEIIISFALFAILMGGIYGIIISAMKNNKAGEVKQTAALYGQEVFEDIKSGPITKSDNRDLTLYSGKIFKYKDDDNNYPLENGYVAHITIEKNTSITLDKSGNDGESTSKEYRIYDFSFDISSVGNNVKVQKKDGSDLPLTLNTTGDEPVKFSVEASTKDNKKVVEIKSDNNEKLLPVEVPIDENIKDGGIKLILNFSGYGLRNFERDKEYKPIEITVKNKDNIALNISLEKCEELKVDIDDKLGKVKLYDNRPEDIESTNSAELYDITVKVTRNGKETTEFTGQISQNIKFK